MARRRGHSRPGRHHRAGQLIDGLRGNGLGPALVAELSGHLSFARDDVIGLLQPQPDGWSDMDPATYAIEKAKVERAWAKVTFRPTADPEVWWTMARDAATVEHSQLVPPDWR